MKLFNIGKRKKPEKNDGHRYDVPNKGLDKENPPSFENFDGKPIK